MAIRKGKSLSGSIDKFVYRKWRKLNIVQSAPGKGGVKQTEATKKASSLFGMASGMATEVREMLSFFIVNFYDGSHHNRLTTLLKSILEKCLDKTTYTFTFVQDSFERLNGLEFNANSPLTNYMKVIPTSNYKDGVMTVTVPELINKQEFIFPKETSSCIITIGTESFDLERMRRTRGYKLHSFEVDDAQALIESQTFEFEVPDGCLCIVGITLQYYLTDRYGKNRVNSKALNPSGICGAIITPGDFKEEQGELWTTSGLSTDKKSLNAPRKKATVKVTSDKSATTDQASPHSQP